MVLVDFRTSICIIIYGKHFLYYFFVFKLNHTRIHFRLKRTKLCFTKFQLFLRIIDRSFFFVAILEIEINF